MRSVAFQLHALRRKCAIYPYAGNFYARIATYVHVTGARKKGVGYATAVSPQGIRVLDSYPHAYPPTLDSPSLSRMLSLFSLLSLPYFIPLRLYTFDVRLHADFSYHFSTTIFLAGSLGPHPFSSLPLCSCIRLDFPLSCFCRASFVHVSTLVFIPTV